MNGLYVHVLFQAKWMNFYTDLDKGGLYLD